MDALVIHITFRVPTEAVILEGDLVSDPFPDDQRRHPRSSHSLQVAEENLPEIGPAGILGRGGEVVPPEFVLLHIMVVRILEEDQAVRGATVGRQTQSDIVNLHGCLLYRPFAEDAVPHTV